MRRKLLIFLSFVLPLIARAEGEVSQVPLADPYILLENGKKPETACGCVRNIGRDGQEATLCTLAELKDAELDMFTTAFVGTADTFVSDGRLITPRGYRGTGGDA